jgi:hypothetical protein
MIVHLRSKISSFRRPFARAVETCSGDEPGVFA